MVNTNYAINFIMRLVDQRKKIMTQNAIFLIRLYLKLHMAATQVQWDDNKRTFSLEALLDLKQQKGKMTDTHERVSQKLLLNLMPTTSSNGKYK